MTHPSRYELEQLFVGEIDSSDVRQHVEHCSECSGFMEEMQQAQQHLLQREPGEMFISNITRPQTDPVPQPVSARFRTLTYAWSLAAALLLGGAGYFLFVHAHKAQPVTVADSPQMRWKGAAPVVEVFLNRNDDVHVSKDDVLFPGDQVQYRVTIPGGNTGYGALVSLENGQLQSIFPSDETGSALPLRGTAQLPRSVVIEDNTVDLSLVLIVRNQSFRITDLLHEMRESLHREGSLKNLNGLVSMHHVQHTPGNIGGDDR